MYKLYKNVNGEIDTIIRLSDNAFIPVDPKNIDYLHYLDWLNEGNTPEPADSTESSE
jgi:hypothetical protein